MVFGEALSGVELRGVDPDAEAALFVGMLRGVATQWMAEPRCFDLDAVRELLESYGLGPAVKAVLRHKGIGAYRTRPPLLDLDRESEVRLIREFDDEVPGPRQNTSP